MLKPVFVWENKVLKSISPADVMCLCTEGNYTKIVLADKSYYHVRSSLSSALKQLPPEIFIKIHRAYAVSIHFIETIERDHLTVGGEPLPISRQYYNKVIRQINVIN